MKIYINNELFKEVPDDERLWTPIENSFAGSEYTLQNIKNMEKIENDVYITI